MSKKKVAPKLTYKFDVMNEKPMLDEFTRTQLKLALERLVQKGLIFDTGRRRNGQIVWAKTPLARSLCPEALDAMIKGIKH